MRALPVIAVLAGTLLLSACKEDVACTAEEAQKKATDLTAKITELATTDPAKLTELGPKVQELSAKAAAGGDDLNAACKAMDEMMAELSK